MQLAGEILVWGIVGFILVVLVAVSIWVTVGVVRSIKKGKIR